MEHRRFPNDPPDGGAGDTRRGMCWERATRDGVNSVVSGAFSWITQAMSATGSGALCLVGPGLDLAVLLPECLLVELSDARLGERFDKQNLVRDSVFRDHAGIG